MKKINKNSHKELKQNSIKSEIFRSVLSNIHLSDYSLDDQKTIVEIVREVTRKTVINKESISKISEKERVAFNVYDKSAKNIEEEKGIKIRAWIPKPTHNDISRLIYKKDTRFGWIPKPPKGQK